MSENVLGKLIPLGTKVPPYGEVCAVHSDGFERSYFMVDKDGHVARMPQDIVEAIVNAR